MNYLFQEYEEQSTAESQLVKDLDKFDMILQAYEYEVSEKRPGYLDGFFKNTENKFKHPIVIQWVDELYCQRNNFLKSNESSK